MRAVRAALAPALAIAALTTAACDPVAPPPPPPVIADVAIGDRHSCALSDDGRIFCWGDGASGQLGTGALASERFPTPVSSDVPFVAVTAGGAHTCALTAGREAYCWGASERGQAGVAGAEAVLTPTQVGPPADAPAGADSRFIALSAGAAHTCGLAGDGTAWCWGAGGDGRLGDGGTEDRAAPAAVAGAEAIMGFREISAGGRHTCALTTADEAWCWGANDFGQLGIGTAGDPAPVPTPVATAQSFEDIAAGGDHTCAVPPGGRVHCWGGNARGQLGNTVRSEPGQPGETEPVPIWDTNVFARISAGREYTCGVRVNGEAMCWGRGEHGQLGDGRLSDSSLQRLVLPEPGRRFTFDRGPWARADAGGDGHVCGLTRAGVALCWGRGDHGQLGNGDWLSTVPQRVRFSIP